MANPRLIEQFPDTGEGAQIARFHALFEAIAIAIAIFDHEQRLVSANASVASLKWTRPDYARQLRATMGPEVDYARRPAEDFARGTLLLEDEQGQQVMIEASTSWAYVGPGLRIQIELLGPEYAMELSTLNTVLKVFLSRQVRGSAGEDLVEKQNAEQGCDPAQVAIRKPSRPELC